MMSNNIGMGSKTIVQYERVKVRTTELAYYRLESVEVVKLDFNSLFSVVHHLLNHSTSLADKCLLGKNEEIRISAEVPTINNCALDVLKRIHCKVACGGAESDGAEVEKSVSNDILQSYSWAEKAVMTLAAFALSYGEVMFFVEHRDLNPCASLISSLRRVDGIHAVKQDQQFKKAIMDLNRLTKVLLKLVESILQLHSLAKLDHIIDVTEIALHVETFSRFAIQVALQCIALVNYLTSQRIKTADLSSITDIVDNVFQTLQETIVAYKSQRDYAEEWNAYSKLHTSICNGRGIVEVMTCMMYPEAVLSWNQTSVSVNELEGKNIVLFISRVDNMSVYDLNNLVEIHKMLEKDHQDYKIVWIPFLEDSVVKDEEKSSDDWPLWLVRKFDDLKGKMPWYVVNYERVRQIVGIKYIRERWQFDYNSIVVLLNSRGMLQCPESPDVMPMIRAWQTWAFPFNGNQVPDHGIGRIIFNITKKKMEKEEYIFLYGGKEQGWVNKFGLHVKELAGDNNVVMKSAKISLASLCISGTSMDIEQFWSSIESMLRVRMQWGLSYDMTKQIQKLLSFKDKKGWAILCKGNRVLACAAETIMMDTVAEWRVWAKEIASYASFEMCFLTQLKKKQAGGGGRLPCCHVPFQSLSGWLPVNVQCPDCDARMERIVTYRCCHDALYNK